MLLKYYVQLSTYFRRVENTSVKLCQHLHGQGFLPFSSFDGNRHLLSDNLGFKDKPVKITKVVISRLRSGHSLYISVRPPLHSILQVALENAKCLFEVGHFEKIVLAGHFVGHDVQPQEKLFCERGVTAAMTSI